MTAEPENKFTRLSKHGTPENSKNKNRHYSNTDKTRCLIICDCIFVDLILDNYSVN